jgi:flagellar basal body-associated protein FliL
MKNIQCIILISLASILALGCSKAPQEVAKDGSDKAIDAKSSENHDQKDAGKTLPAAKEDKQPIYVELVDPVFVNLPASPGKKGGEHFLEVELILQTTNSSVEGYAEKMKADVKAMVITIGALREKDLLFNQGEKAMLAKELAIGLSSLFDPELTMTYLQYQQTDELNPQTIGRLKAMGIFPKVAKVELSNEALIGARALSLKDLPVQAVLFKKFKMQ